MLLGTNIIIMPPKKVSETSRKARRQKIRTMIELKKELTVKFVKVLKK